MMNLTTSQNEHLDDTGPAPRGQHVSAARMQRAVLKLAFSFYGQDPALDGRLKHLGSLIKSVRKDGIVQALIDEVVDLIVAREGHAASPHEAAARQLAELIGRLSLEGPLAEEARAIQRRLQRISGKEEFEHQYNEVVGLFNLLGRSGASDGDDELRESELFDNFLAELQLPPELGAAMDIVRDRLRRQHSQAMLFESARDVARMLTARLREVPSPSSPDVFAAAIALARAQLQVMLEQLVLPAPIAKETLRIKAVLDVARDEHDIQAAVGSILELLNQARGCSQQKIEELTAFLRAVTRRLEDFRFQVARNNALHDESVSSTNLFEHTMSRQVADMRGRVDVETDLDTLKRVMLDQIENLEHSVQHFVRDEQSRQAEVTSQFKQLTERLGELETETVRLRSDLDEQHTLSLLDPLTAVYNRMGYNESMQREFTRWKRYGGILSLLVFDLDLFKSINDTYGHAAGDKVLISVAQLVRKQIRRCDIQCRLGGEEFAVILPATDVHSAAIVGEKLRANIANSQFRFKELPVPVTVSVGVAEFRGDDAPEDVFDRADRALYLAKKRGRNHSCTELELDDAASAQMQVVETIEDPGPTRVIVRD